MSHPDHDAIVEAFQRAESRVRICHRGGAKGYTHIHGPSKGPPTTRAHSNHAVVVEKYNGTTSPCHAIAVHMNAPLRPLDERIEVNPIGYSTRSKYGRFERAFHFGTIEDKSRWTSVDAFVAEVIAIAKKTGDW
jgi:hypothetical protein